MLLKHVVLLSIEIRKAKTEGEKTVLVSNIIITIAYSLGINRVISRHFILFTLRT